MGQVLGFSHCQEYGSVSSTPDSTTPPCTDGGNEESELYDLQTAREWSDDDDCGLLRHDDEDDDEGLASSSSLWGTPRQTSLELTFSYIAIAEPEAVGASRNLRDAAGRRRGGAARGARVPMVRTDTLETLLDSPDVEWDPHAFLDQDEDEEEGEEGRGREVPRQTVPVQLSLLESELGPHGMDSAAAESGAGSDREEMTTETSGRVSEHHPSLHHHHHPTALQHPSPSYVLQAAVPSPPSQPESLVATETVPARLLMAVRPVGGLKGDTVSAVSSALIGPNTQERLVSEQWFSALNLSEDPMMLTHIAVMDLIYWKDMERTGMVFTGLVVGLLSLFQLSMVTVISTLSLAVMCFTISVRIYYKVLHVLNCGDGCHPFKAYLDLDLSLSGEQADHYMQRAIVVAVSAVNTLKRLLFVSNLFDSLKLLTLVYLVTYFGDMCNGLTLLIIGVISLFSVPLFYQQRQAQVDSFFAKIQADMDNIKDILHRITQGGGSPADTTPGGAKPKDH